ncbi:ubiquitin carboxy terminal hydrolase Ubp10 [Schizosaccharomyces japonicus yFS275]|uniref:Ubiquitin carboxy terminal hydrolase Ubp10 n=1 Tax=Schizosaccharomyces japonicus (strain yFS275 / FY16936) TaxID=402676 RepID=B6K735_SCHJY|nr:ubiquitin carboxy terminal hydrolase Ubp10 [Schizosaccharomyces japonicus yFS275]EEB09339.1 ubiquitin carboxy terminal hydrolase Ubp10 [Schizosaccharomyces japonicus yFS275]
MNDSEAAMSGSLKRKRKDENDPTELRTDKTENSNDVQTKAKNASLEASTNDNNKFEDLYLDTINRSMLDFDFDKLCSVSLSNLNVYACLVCGKYYQGRGPNSYAYVHALTENHHVFVNCSTLRFYILPESYQVTSAALDDIKYVMQPTYTKEQVSQLDVKETTSYDLDKKPYFPGFIGMNNIKQNDYLNVIVQALAHVKPFRNYFLLTDFSSSPSIVQRLATLIRKIWNPRAFKNHVSPQELTQEITVLSHKKYSVNEQQDPIEFLTWLLSTLHVALGGSRKKVFSLKPTSIIHYIFQGCIRMESQKIHAQTRAGDHIVFEADRRIEVNLVPFLYLTLDPPPKPLFQDEFEGNIIPQVSVYELLTKYNGVTTQELAGFRRRFHITHAPSYIMFHVKRFTRNNYFPEHNPTIVTFPLEGLDLAPYIDKTFLEKNPKLSTIYNLCVNIVHESIFQGENESHVFKVQVKNKATNKWYQIQDLYVEEVSSDLINLGETYIQIWERQTRLP